MALSQSVKKVYYRFCSTLLDALPRDNAHLPRNSPSRATKSLATYIDFDAGWPLLLVAGRYLQCQIKLPPSCVPVPNKVIADKCHGRMKLDELHIPQVRAYLAGLRIPVARSIHRVRGYPVQPAEPAGGQYHC